VPLASILLESRRTDPVDSLIIFESPSFVLPLRNDLFIQDNMSSSPPVPCRIIRDATKLPFIPRAGNSPFFSKDFSLFFTSRRDSPFSPRNFSRRCWLIFARRFGINPLGKGSALGSGIFFFVKENFCHLFEENKGTQEFELRHTPADKLEKFYH
jgi:hypothetical protein